MTMEGILLPGWTCPSCLVFNGEMKEERSFCRACGAGKPASFEPAEDPSTIRNRTNVGEALSKIIVGVIPFKPKTFITSTCSSLAGSERLVVCACGLVRGSDKACEKKRVGRVSVDAEEGWEEL